MEHSKEYRRYISSRGWNKIRQALIQLAGGKCQVCKRQSARLEVHHLNYDNLGSEGPKDVLVCCPDCHRVEDQKRSARVAEERVASNYDARLEGWASKKYGEEWRLQRDEQAVEEDFERWRERKDEQEW